MIVIWVMILMMLLLYDTIDLPINLRFQGITTCYIALRDRAKVVLKMLYETGQGHIPVALGRNTSNIDEPIGMQTILSAQGFEKLNQSNSLLQISIIENIRNTPRRSL
ncbi:MAG: hypothetical protein U0V04_08910 [Spirosomataceae bacterium]